MVDHYAALGVNPTASADELKKAWRRSVVTHHPDRGGDREKFDAVQAAWEVLSDPGARAAYDRARLLGNRRPPSPPFSAPFATPAEATSGGGSAVGAVYDRLFNPPPDPVGSPGLLFVFADGTEVTITATNARGAFVPTDDQRRTYRMGPAWVYRLLRPGDRLLQVAAPRSPRDDDDVPGLVNAAGWWALRGPGWLAPRWSMSAALCMVVAATLAWFGATVLSGGATGASAASTSWVAAMVSLCWWPVRKLVAITWNLAPATVAGACTAAMGAAIGAGSVVVFGALAWRAVVLWALGAAVVGAAMGGGLGVVSRQLRKWLFRRAPQLSTLLLRLRD